MPLGQDIRQVIGDGRLMAYLASGFCSNIGTWVQRLAVGWLVFDLTASVAWVGVIAACEVLPALLVQPFGGVLIDRFHRTRVLALGNMAAFVQALGLMLLYLAGLLDTWLIVAAAVLLGLLEGINQPARLTMIAEFADRDRLRVAISLNSLSFNLARFIGPLVASLLLLSGHVTLAFACNAASFLPMIVLLLRLRPGARRLAEGPPESFGRAILAGLVYVRGQPLVRDLLLLAVVVNICCRALLELLPAITGHWHANDPAILALLTSAAAAGAMAGGLLILTRSDMPAVLRAVLWLSLLICLAAMAMGLAGQHRIAAALAAFCMGLGASGSAVGVQNIIHHATNPLYLGRTMALYGLAQRGAAVIGAVVIGIGADLAGFRAPSLAAAAIGIVAVIIAMRKILPSNFK